MHARTRIRNLVRCTHLMGMEWLWGGVEARKLLGKVGPCKGCLDTSICRYVPCYVGDMHMKQSRVLQADLMFGRRFGQRDKVQRVMFLLELQHLLQAGGRLLMCRGVPYQQTHSTLPTPPVQPFVLVHRALVSCYAAVECCDRTTHLCHQPVTVLVEPVIKQSTKGIVGTACTPLCMHYSHNTGHY